MNNNCFNAFISQLFFIFALVCCMLILAVSSKRNDDDEEDVAEWNDETFTDDDMDRMMLYESLLEELIEAADEKSRPPIRCGMKCRKCRNDCNKGTIKQIAACVLRKRCYSKRG